MKPHKLLLTSLLTVLALSASAQGTAFTYQGQLNSNGSPASGTYNLTFSLFNTNTSGVAVAGPVTNNAVGVTNGLFTVLIDFGPGAFTVQTNWLEIAVETNGANTFTTLAPRQQLTPMPYAIYAESAGGLSGSLPASQLTSIGNTNGGNYNFFVGSAGNSTMGGWYNTAIGDSAFGNNTNGTFNTAIGSGALFFNTSGSHNSANGVWSLCFNTSGSYNTANGYEALYSNTDGFYNTANGSGALHNNTSGFNNTASGAGALSSNTTGYHNTANGSAALSDNTSGFNNTANGYCALCNNESGSNNIALGYLAGYEIRGSSNIDIGNNGFSTDNNIIRIGTSQTAIYLPGTVYAASFSPTSDRNAKENFTAVNAREVLAKVASLPVTEWNYKTDSKDVQHIGPMAQDFQAAFGLNGPDDKHISMVDEGGVALAAIQGLNQMFNEKDAEIQDLKQSVAELKKLVQSLAERK